MSSQYTKLATNIVSIVLKQKQDNKPDYYSQSIVLPITKVDGVSCCARLKITPKAVALELGSDRDYLVKQCDGETEREEISLYDKWFQHPETLNVGNICELLGRMFEQLGTLKFNNVTTHFENPEEADIFDFIKSIPNVSNGDECCVCHDLTRYETHCGHTICYLCLSKIRYDDDMEIICPMCRECL